MVGPAFFRRIFGYFAADGWLLAALVVLIWICLAAGILEGAAVGVLTDSVISSHTRSDPASRVVQWPLGGDRAARILALAGMWLALRLINDVALLLREMINNQVRYNGTARVRMRLFDHLQELGPEYHKTRPQGDAIYRLSTDAQGFFGVLDTFVGAANSVLTVVVVGFVMAGFNLTITVVCLCLLPLLLATSVLFGRTIRRTSLTSKQADTDLTTFMQRSMDTVGLIQLFRRQRDESRSFGGAVRKVIRQGMRMSWQMQLYPFAQRAIFALGYMFVLGYGGYLALRAQTSAGTFTVGSITAMLVYFGQIWEPVRRMAGFTADVQNNLAACARVFVVLDWPPAVADSPDAQPLPLAPRELELRHVAFAYDPAKPVLIGVDARIEPGEMVAFVGPSGSGKSTLLNLLPRFYDPQGGAILLDGHDLRGVLLHDVRAHVALVPQDSPVVAGSIAENIAFGRPGASRGQIARAAALAGADGFIEQLPQGYDTPVTEGGQNLSGGQRQRLAIARALLTEAPILLLDEPTSGLDPANERLILQTLHQLKGHRTIILVTHNLAAVTACDRIYVLSGGHVAESGTHTELLARGGPYAAMAAAVPVTATGDEQRDTAANSV